MKKLKIINVILPFLLSIGFTIGSIYSAFNNKLELAGILLVLSKLEFNDLLQCIKEFKS